MEERKKETTTIFRPNHTLLILSSEPLQNVAILKKKYARVRRLKYNIGRTRISRWLGRKIRIMWLGRVILVVGLPPLPGLSSDKLAMYKFTLNKGVRKNVQNVL